MRILALVPARGGSKRLPGKNIRLLGGRPLIAWSVDVAKTVPDICDILISTDDASIAKVGRSTGALVPWLRPAELSTDSASSVDVCVHALDWYEHTFAPVDALLLLQPTSPFRTRESIQRGLELFRMHGKRSVIGVSPAQSHPLWCFRIDGDRMRRFVDSGELVTRSQDLPQAVVINGAFYLIAPAALRQQRSFCDEDTVPLLIERPEEAIDIDTEWDWLIAEAFVARAPVCARASDVAEHG